MLKAGYRRLLWRRPARRQGSRERHVFDPGVGVESGVVITTAFADQSALPGLAGLSTRESECRALALMLVRQDQLKPVANSVGSIGDLAGQFNDPIEERNVERFELALNGVQCIT